MPRFQALCGQSAALVRKVLALGAPLGQLFDQGLAENLDDDMQDLSDLRFAGRLFSLFF